MRAAVYRRYGPPEVVEIAEVATPTPRDDEVLVKVRATTVTSGDWRLRTASVPPGFALLIRLAFGIFKPRRATLGVELAGDVGADQRSIRWRRISGGPAYLSLRGRGDRGVQRRK